MTHVPVELHTLSNGLRVVASPDRRVPVVAVNLWYHVGSRDEEEGRTGFAHLFEHMMFEGSVNVPPAGHIAHIERMGGSMNGSTWFDRTNYFQTVPAHYLERVLWLESDRMGYFLPALTEDTFRTQREVVKNERRWRVDNQPYGDWDERMQAMLFPVGHPYHHPVIGSMEDLDAATLDDVRDFFRAHYRSDNAVLTVCGDFDPENLLSIVDRYFGAIRAEGSRPDGRSAEPLEWMLPERTGSVVRSDVALPRIYLGWRMPPFGTEAFVRGDFTAHLLTAGKTSRLYDALVRRRRLVASVGAYAFPLTGGVSIWMITATLLPEASIEEVAAVIDEELRRLAAEPPGEAEMERVLAGIETAHRLSMQDPGQRADDLSMYTTFFDDPDRINREIDRYRELAPADVADHASAYLDPERQARLEYHPHDGRVGP